MNADERRGRARTRKARAPRVPRKPSARVDARIKRHAARTLSSEADRPSGFAPFEMRIAFGREIRERRERHGLRQVDLARKLRTNQPLIDAMELGNEPSLRVLVEALLVLGVSPEEIRALAD